MSPVVGEHKPVLLNEVMEYLAPQPGDFIIDCTFGRGGYSAAILDRLGDDGRLLAVDADPYAIAHGERIFVDEPRLSLVHDNYDRVQELLGRLDMPLQVNGVVFDLGVSSPQLDNESRGFSFQAQGPLDMRMNPNAGQSAAEWLALVSANELASVISQLGEDNMARRIARRIVDVREKTPIVTTTQLAEIVSAAIPERDRRQRKIHPATKTFQAIRMYINDELGHLRKGLQQALALLVPGGRVVAVSFHSLEDRIVKKIFRHAVQGERLPDRMPVTRTHTGGGFEYIAQLIRPSDDEIRLNPRSRSAKMRALRKIP